MGLIGSIESAGLALRAQSTMQRKALDHQAENFLILLAGVIELGEKVNGGRDDNLGIVVDVKV